MRDDKTSVVESDLSARPIEFMGNLNGFQPLNFATETSNDKAVLDFFTYNPVLHSYPRAGIFNLNTRNVPVLAAALKAALKNDTIAVPPSSDVISASEATAAAQQIVDETKLRPVLNRGDVARLVRVGANAAWTKEQKEAIARALAEMGQARTWNLMIDVIAQMGKCAPGETDRFIVEGEKNATGFTSRWVATLPSTGLWMCSARSLRK